MKHTRGLLKVDLVRVVSEITRQILPLKEKRRIAMICNLESKTPQNASFAKNSFVTEYLDDVEYEEVLNMFAKAGWLVETFFHEDAFIRWVYQDKHEDALVYNSAQSGFGPGRKSLIPAFCNLHNIPITGSNPYVVSLCRNKFHVNTILDNRGISVPKSWLYDRGKWLQGEGPDTGKKIICKPIYESACIGIDDTSIFEYAKEKDIYIMQKNIDYEQPILAQSFIPGYEVSVPVIVKDGNISVGGLIGISIESNKNLDDNILTYDTVYKGKYAFYDYGSEFPSQVSHIENAAALTAQILGFNGLCRVDMRIGAEQLYITDVATNPHFISHSACHYMFEIMGLEPCSIMDVLIGTIPGDKLFGPKLQIC